MFLRASVLVAFGVAIAAADEVHLSNCMATGPGRPADEYSVMEVSPTISSAAIAL